MRKTPFIAAALGLAFLTALVVREGVADVAGAFLVAGWGILWVTLYRFVPTWVDTLGWLRLFEKPVRTPRTVMFTARWVSESFNTLLPMAEVGGYFVRARMIKRYGVAVAEAGATVLVDFILSLSTLVLFAIIGTAILFHISGKGGGASGIMMGLSFGILLVVGFYFALRMGLLGRFLRVFRILLKGKQGMFLASGAEAMDRNISSILNRRPSLLVSSGLKLLAWILRSGESWLCLYFLGFPVTFQEAVVLESISTAMRSAAFVVPGGLGVQEGGLLFTGSQIGISPDVTLALGLMKRVREILVGIPGLIVWSISEGRASR
jgi:putative membrane protein